MIKRCLLLLVSVSSPVSAVLELRPVPDVLWQEEFERVSLDPAGRRGWRVTDAEGRVSMALEADNGRGRLSTRPAAGSPRASRYVPYDFAPASRDFAPYLQVRVAEGRSFTWCILDGSLKGTVIPALDASRRGLFTASYVAATRPDRKGKRLSGSTALNIYGSGVGFVALDVLRMARRPSEGVYVTLSKAQGTPAAERELICAGDTLRVEMPVPESLDANTLALWRIDRKAFVPLAQADLPAQLYDDGSHGDLQAHDLTYSCEFVVSPTDVATTTDVNALVVDVEAWGQDHHARGHFYGLCPYASNLPAGVSSAADSALRLFDLGAGTSPVLAGATPITTKARYSKETGYGWTVRAYGHWQSTMPDALTQDCCYVKPGMHADFRVDVEPGTYRVGVIPGFAGHVRQHFLPLDSYRITANGKTIAEQDLTPAEHLRERLALTECDYRKSEADVYDLYLAPMLSLRTATVSAPDGEIVVRLEANGAMRLPVCAVAVYPAEGTPGHNESIALLERIERQRRQSFHRFWSFSEPSDGQLDDPLTCTDAQLPERVRDKGYAVFTRRDPFEYVYIYSRPRRTELERPVRLLACPGQTVPASIGLYPVGALTGTTIEVTDLAADDGTRIAREHVDLFYVVQYHYAALHNRVHWIAPNHFVPPRSRDFEAGVCRNYWLRVRVPPDAAPGVYTGELKVSAQNAPSTELPLSVRVLPTRLPELDDHLIAFINHMFFRGDEYLDREMAFMRDVGCTAAECHFSWATTSTFQVQDGQIVGGTIDSRPDAAIERFLDGYRQTGFPFRWPVMGLMALNPNYAFRFGQLKPSDPLYPEAVRWSYRRLSEMAKSKGFEGIVAYLGGEMGSGPREPSAETLQQAAEVVTIINSVPDVKTLYDCNCAATARELSPLLDLAGMRQQQAWAVADAAYRRGRDKWLVTYSVGGRFWNGLDSWRHGARGNFREYLTYPVMLPYNDFAGNCLTGHVHAMEGLDGPVPTVRSEMWRASIDDRRYVRMLEHELGRQQVESRTSTEARQFLSSLRAELERQPPWTFGAHWNRGDDEPRDIDQDLVRWLVSVQALELSGVKLIDDPLPAIALVAASAPVAAQQPAPFAPSPVPDEASPTYDDSVWVPIEVGKGWEAQGIKYDGVAWYRVAFDVPPDWAHVWLAFEAVDETAWVYLNGNYLGTHEGWSEPFALDATPATGRGQTNVLAIRVLDTAYQGGIWKPACICNADPEGKADVERRSLSQGWKLALRPPPGGETRAFGLKFGRLYRRGESATIASLLLIPPDDASARALITEGGLIQIVDWQGNLRTSRRIHEMKLYMPSETDVSIAGLETGRYVARLSAGQMTADYEFTIVPGP